MGRLSASLSVLALAAAAALGLVACGGGDDANLLPGETASEINSNIDAVERLVGEGDCIGAEDASATVTGQVESLDGVDAELKRALSEGAAKLSEAVAECQEEPAETTEFEPSEEEVEAEEQEREEQEKQEKPGKEKPEKEAPEETGEESGGPTLPPQSNGKGEEKGGGPPEETESPSGGIGPGVAAGEEG